jgi:small subunit ribosomal protein S6
MFDYCGNGALVKELERNIRLDDRSLKYMTVCVSDNVDLEKVRLEKDAAQREKTEASQRPQASTTDEEEQTSPWMNETTDAMPGPDYDEEATDGSNETDERF